MPVAACTSCKEIMGSFAVGHTEEECPIRRGSYCNLCCANGHSPAECKDSVILGFREPQFLEQLVAPSLLETYGITTMTPISGKSISPVIATDDILEVPETDEALRTILTFYGVKPMICQEKGKADKKELKENKKRLQKVADGLGRKLVFVAEDRRDLSEVAKGLGSLFDGAGGATTPKKIAGSFKGVGANGLGKTEEGGAKQATVQKTIKKKAIAEKANEKA